MSSETDLTHLEKNLFSTFNADATDARFQALMKLFAVVRAAESLQHTWNNMMAMSSGDRNYFLDFTPWFLELQQSLKNLTALDT